MRYCLVDVKAFGVGVQFGRWMTPHFFHGAAWTGFDLGFITVYWKTPSRSSGSARARMIRYRGADKSV